MPPLRAPGGLSSPALAEQVSKGGLRGGPSNGLYGSVPGAPPKLWGCICDPCSNKADFQVLERLEEGSGEDFSMLVFCVFLSSLLHNIYRGKKVSEEAA